MNRLQQALDTVVERVTKNAVQMEAWNPNHVGGDISNSFADERRVNHDRFAPVIGSIERDIFDHALNDRVQSARTDVLGRRIHRCRQVSHLP